MPKRSYSIKHVPNKNLKPIVDPIDPSIKLYPVYVQLIYKRKNYLFKSIVTTYYTELNSPNKNDIDLMAFENNFLSNIIEFEITEKKEKFDVPRFAFKYEKYRRSIVIEAERLLIGEIEYLMRSGKSKFQNIIDYRYEPGKFHLLLEATRVLVPDIRENAMFKKCELSEIFWEQYNNSFPKKEKYGLIFPTLYDWLKKGHKTVMHDFIESTFKGDNARLLMEYLDGFDTFMRTQIIDI
jgi:hypothetical protein